MNIFDRGADNNNLFIVLHSKMSTGAAWRPYHMLMAHLF